MPVSTTAIGEFVAVLTTDRPAETLPVAGGAKLTARGRLWPAARVTDPENPLTPNAAFVVETCEIVTLPVPVFVNEIGREPEAPTRTEPKLSELGLGVRR